MGRSKKIAFNPLSKIRWPSSLSWQAIVDHMFDETTESSKLDVAILEDRVLYSATPLPVEVVDPALMENIDANLNLIEDQLALDDSNQSGLPESDTFDSDSDSFDFEQLNNLLEFASFDHSEPIEVVFVDSGVEDSELLLQGLRSQSDSTQWLVFEMNSTRDGVAQITATLKHLDGIDAIHLVSHGNGSGIQLGSTWLDLENRSQYQQQIESWSAALDTGADLLIYGCDLASTEDGRELTSWFAEHCDCDVAASDDPTGHTDLGGDWILEYSIGDVNSELAFSYNVQSSWLHLLEEPQAASEVIFVQGNLHEHQAFVDEIESQAAANGRSVDIHILDSSENGFVQIDTLLSQYGELDAIHIVSHGDAELLQLGSSWLTASNVDQHLE